MSQDYSNTKSVGGRDLRDFALARENELTRILAGLALLDPPFVVELVKGLRPDDLTDELARKFLLALKPDSSPADLALELGLANEYMRWLGLASDHLWGLRTVGSELKKLVVLRQGLDELQGWLAEAARMGRHL